MFQDFQAETLKDCGTGQLYGLEKFWAFVKYYKHANELHVEPQLKAKLEPFKTIEDFKVLYTVSAKKLKAYLDRSWNETMIRIHIMNKMLYCAGATDFRKPITKKFSVLRHH